MSQENGPEPSAVTSAPNVFRVGYVDAAFVSLNAFSMHVVLGTSTHAGEIVPHVELTLSREFARHLAGALERALAQPEEVRSTPAEPVSASTNGASTQPGNPEMRGTEVRR